MTSREFSLLVFMCFYLFTNNLVRGIDILMDDVQTYKKNTTFLHRKSLINEATKATMFSQNNSVDNKTIARSKGWRKKKPTQDKSLSLGNVTNVTPTYFSTTAIRWAMIRTTTGSYHGATATFAVYGLPTVLKYQRTEASIMVTNDAGGSLHRNQIQAGWHVDPLLYGDTDTHFFVFWEGDELSNNTGCYNLFCEGFVVDNSSSWKPGAILRPLSTFKGDQWVIILTIIKNEETADWWLYYGLPQANRPIGHWPSSIFTTLQDCASYIDIGGAVSSEKGVYSPPMGSGHFPEQGLGKAAYITDIQLVNKSGHFYQIENGNFDIYHGDDEDCYSIKGDIRGDVYFGGPGGCID